MANFEEALAFVLPHEGGYCDIPEDPGGATNFGVTFAVAKKWGINTKEELKNISDELVANIYKTDYWVHDGINKQRLATKVFDAGVNMGVRTSIKILQRCLNNLGQTPYLVVDGMLGPITLRCINEFWDEGRLLREYCQEMEEHYRDIVSIRPTSGKFLKGWIKRAWDLPK